MNQKEGKIAREKLALLLMDMDFGEFVPVGRTTEGVLLEDDKGNYIVVKTIVKSENFDAEDAMEEYQERLEKAKAAAEKKAAKVEKAKKEKEKKEKDEAEVEAEPDEDKEVLGEE